MSRSTPKRKASRVERVLRRSTPCQFGEVAEAMLAEKRLERHADWEVCHDNPPMGENVGFLELVEFSLALGIPKESQSRFQAVATMAYRAAMAKLFQGYYTKLAAELDREVKIELR